MSPNLRVLLATCLVVTLTAVRKNDEADNNTNLESGGPYVCCWSLKPGVLGKGIWEHKTVGISKEYQQGCHVIANVPPDAKGVDKCVKNDISSETHKALYEAEQAKPEMDKAVKAALEEKNKAIKDAKAKLEKDIKAAKGEEGKKHKDLGTAELLEEKNARLALLKKQTEEKEAWIKADKKEENTEIETREKGLNEKLDTDLKAVEVKFEAAKVKAEEVWKAALERADTKTQTKYEENKKACGGGSDCCCKNLKLERAFKVPSTFALAECDQVGTYSAWTFSKCDYYTGCKQCEDKMCTNGHCAEDAPKKE